jgi:hypothetical protein
MKIDGTTSYDSGHPKDYRLWHRLSRWSGSANSKRRQMASPNEISGMSEILVADFIFSGGRIAKNDSRKLMIPPRKDPDAP